LIFDDFGNVISTGISKTVDAALNICLAKIGIFESIFPTYFPYRSLSDQEIEKVTDAYLSSSK